MVSYSQDCPICGRQLAPNASGPTAPPWRCDQCLRSWWVAELTPEARVAFRPERRDWGPPSSPAHKAVREAVHVEQGQALARGVSLRREQLGLVLPRTLHSLAGLRGVAPTFAEHMRKAAR